MAKSTNRATGPSVELCCPSRPRFQPSAGHSWTANAFKALSDETRLGILQLIVEAGPLCACEFVAHFDLRQPTISHHLKQLREAGLVRAERRGTWIYYRAEPKSLAALTTHRVFRPATSARAARCAEPAGRPPCDLDP